MLQSLADAVACGTIGDVQVVVSRAFPDSGAAGFCRRKSLAELATAANIEDNLNLISSESISKRRGLICQIRTDREKLSV